MLYIPRLLSPRHNVHFVLLATALAAGCSSGSRPDVSEAGVSNLCIQANCTPDPNGVCQHTCTADPGPALVDCVTAEANYDFTFPGKKDAIWTFESAFDGGTMGLARGMYSYTDNSTVIQTFKTINNQTGLYGPKTWEPPTAVMARCWDPNDHTKPLDPMNRAIHIQGGPFLSWGGGVGIGMKNFPTVQGSVSAPDAMLDVSSFEGVSFWARRGPDSQVGFRVLVGDKNTDDDISYIMYRDDPTQPRYCERVRECACLNHRSCVAVSLDRADAGTGAIQSNLVPKACQPDPSHLAGNQVMQFCGTPEVINGAESSMNGGSQCDTCFQTRCDERYPAFPDDCGVPGGNCPPGSPNPAGTDALYYGKPCSPYTMRNGISSSWCFDPAKGERPAETTEQCGDHWTHVVNLSNQWQFYVVPFNQMAQQGWAKRSAALDLTSVSVVRFTWDGGWVDYWIDDVRFYRHKPPPQ